MVRMKFFIILLFAASISGAIAAPDWFESDTKTKGGWIFYCKGDAKDENEALNLAQSDCSRKMCMLFGVEVKYQQVSEETLTDVKSKTTVIESCPLVKIVGRVNKKKSVDCEDDKCEAFISQFYPMNEYEAEKKRLNNPPISPTLASTIIIRENNETFLDPKNCRKDLNDFSQETGIRPEDRKKRVEILNKAINDCKGLDYRNVDLQNELSLLIHKNLSSRGAAHAQALMNTLNASPTLIDRITVLLKFESVDTTNATKEAQRLIATHFKQLYAVDNEEVHYINELKTCNSLSKVVRAWPENLTSDITVCHTMNQCQTTSILMVRSSYIGCLCNVGSPQNVSGCFQVLYNHMNNECPLKMDDACFKKMSIQIAEKMKVHISDPYYKGTK